uniref:BRMS1 transcriptional repressor and anoikis regulator n=1 Tax=Astatotilapia calliptera TaxID=8154 RepID=A0A3P8QRV3_ASTCA
MPAQPPVKEPEEEMEAEGESQLPEANGEVEEPRENEGTRGGGAEETMEESTEERETDLEDSDEEEEEEEEEESSEMDDEDCERRRGECLDEMMDLEKQFQELKEKLFRERLNQVKVKLDEVLTGKAGEYREPLAALQNSMQIRTQVAGVYRELCLQVIKHKHECEVQGARQHLESERTLLFDAMKGELLEKIRRLEEDRQNIDLTSEWSDELRGKKCKRKNLLGRSEKKKKVALVSGPFIVYMLRDIDILEDWTAIKKTFLPLSKLLIGYFKWDVASQFMTSASSTFPRFSHSCLLSLRACLSLASKAALVSFSSSSCRRIRAMSSWVASHCSLRAADSVLSCTAATESCSLRSRHCICILLASVRRDSTLTATESHWSRDMS